MVWSKIAEPAGQSKLARQLKLVGLALLFVFVSLIGFASIARCPVVLQTLTTITQSFGAYIRLTNALIAILCAAFVLWPRKGSPLVGHWNDYIGLAFLVFFIQYGTRFSELVYDLQFPHSYYHPLHYIKIVVVYVGSYLNNILFLAAARVLLNKGRQLPTKPPDADSSKLDRLKNEWLRFRSVLPRWIWVMPVVSVVAMAEERFPLWARFPDAIFSVYCLSWLAYAIWLIFLVKKKKLLAWLGFIFLLAYAAGQLVYASNPFVAQSITTQAPTSRVGKKVNNFLAPTKILADIQKRAEAIAIKEESDGVDPKNRKTLPQVATDSLDSAIFALLFPMKSLLFLPIFILYLYAIISVNDFRQALSETTSKRKDYLSTNGILKVIGCSMEADRVDLIIRLPGLRGRPKQEIVLSKIWEKGPDSNEKQSKPYPLNSDPLLVRVLRTEGKEIIITTEDDNRASARLEETDAGPETVALVPITFHGGAIGVLRVIFRGYGKYNSGTLAQLKFMAELIGPSVQDYRTVFATDKLSQRLIRELLRKRTKHERTDKAVDIFRNTSFRIVSMLYDLLNPLGVGLLVQCGFTSDKLLFPTEGPYFDLLTGLNIDYATVLRKLNSNRDGTLMVVPTPEGPVRIEADQLSARTEALGPYDLGSLLLAIPNDKDDFARPTLAAYYLTRRMLASLTAQAIFSAARNALSVTIQDLAVALNSENLSVHEWFAKVQEAIEQAGCVWVVASVGDNAPLMGSPEHVNVIINLSDVDRENLNKEPRGCIPHHVDGMSHRHVIRQSLKTGRQLWIGVARAEFGKELNFRSPWRIFLESMTNVAGAALTRIEERQRVEAIRARDEAQRLREAEDEWMKTIDRLSATLMHQLINMTQNMLARAQELLIDVGDRENGSQSGALTSIKDLKANAEMIMELTTAYNKMIERDGLGSCSVAEAAKLAAKLFRFQLQKTFIEIEIDVSSDIVARVPSNVVAIILAGLIGNAISAIKARGKITIRATAEGANILCDISNNGRPIDEEIVDNLFRPGVKGKDGHTGWGLYLISRTLSRFDGEVKLTNSDLNGVCFTVRLPKSGN